MIAVSLQQFSVMPGNVEQLGIRFLEIYRSRGLFTSSLLPNKEGQSLVKKEDILGGEYKKNYGISLSIASYKYK